MPLQSAKEYRELKCGRMHCAGRSAFTVCTTVDGVLWPNRAAFSASGSSNVHSWTSTDGGGRPACATNSTSGAVSYVSPVMTTVGACGGDGKEQTNAWSTTPSVCGSGTAWNVHALYVTVVGSVSESVTKLTVGGNGRAQRANCARTRSSTPRGQATTSCA